MAIEFSQQRRSLFTSTARCIGGVGMTILTMAINARQSFATAATVTRPPGAQDEDKFLSACTSCGLCVRDCPGSTLKLASRGDSVPLETPYFIPREKPCDMCTDMPCVKACPTDALDKALVDINDARMGLAMVVNRSACIAYRGLRCEVCFNACPLKGKAIQIQSQYNLGSDHHKKYIPVIFTSHCTGCGNCEHACVLDQPAIRVIPL